MTSEEGLFQDRVRERDLDNFLVEELHSSVAFRGWLLQRIEKKFAPPAIGHVRVSKSPQRLQDNRQTDVRVGWFDESDQLLACILIESKVTADFQPGQAESYDAELTQWREVLGHDGACAILMAPEAKFASLSGRHLFDDRVSIEDIVKFLRSRIAKGELCSELADRLEARCLLLEALIGKRQGSGSPPITLPEKREFSDLYAKLAEEVIPALRVKASNDGRKATTKFFEGAVLPTGFPTVRIKHEFGKKNDVKYANLQFDGLAHIQPQLIASGLLNGTDFTAWVSGKALFVRRTTPGIDPTEPFAPQRGKVTDGLIAVRDLVNWMERNAEALVSVLLPSDTSSRAPVRTAPEPQSTDKREREMAAALLDIYRRCERFNYRPRYLLEMMKEFGAIAAVRRLIAKPLSSGFTRLVELEQTELSVEALALQPRWGDLFTTAELGECRRRLGLDVTRVR